MPTGRENFDLVVGSLYSDNSVAAVLRAGEACFLKNYYEDFLKASTTTLNPKGWNNFICIDDSTSPETLASKIHSGGYKYSSLRRITNFEKANLVPKLRFYKTIVDESTGRIKNEIPITFPDSSKENIESLLKGGADRGDDIAIKSFTFDIKNQNPYAASRIAESQLVLVMNSGESLTKPRSGGFKFADLLIRNNRVDPSSFDSDFYQIRAVAGYEIPKSMDSAALKQDLERNKISMILTLIDYDINFEQNGFLTLTLNYVSRIEQKMQNVQKYNIFEDKTFERGLNTARKDARREKRVQSANITKAGKDYEKEVAQAEAQYRKAINAIPEVGEEYTYEVEESLPIEVEGIPVGAPIIQTVEYTATVDQAYRSRLRNEAEEDRNDAIAAADATRTTAIEDAKGQIASLDADLIYLQNQNRIEKYQSILNQLFIFGKVRRLAIPKEALVIYGQAFEDELNAYLTDRFETSTVGGLPALVSEITDTYTFVQNRRDQIQRSVRNQINNSSPVPTTFRIPLEDALTNLAKEIANANGRTDVQISDILAANRSFDVEAFANAAFPASADSFSSDREDKIIYYFYLGDLLEVVLGQNSTFLKLLEDNFAICLGNLRITTVKPVLSTAPVTPGTSPYTELEKDIYMNIADIPIPMESFLRFFKENISNRGLNAYPLADFIRDMVQRLIMTSLNGECFGTSSDNPQSLKIIGFELPFARSSSSSKKRSQEPITDGSYGNANVRNLSDFYVNTFAGPLEGSMRADVSNLILPVKALFGSTPKLARTPSDKRFSYMLMYGLARTQQLTMMGNEDIDASRGIYHFYLGADRGLVKSIDFAKQNDSQIALIMAERAMKAGQEKIELWRNFAANLTLIGNVLLKPGSFIYINPTISGLGNPSNIGSLGRAMGLGGYYMVLRVSNEITESGWTTNVEAVWQSVPPA